MSDIDALVETVPSIEECDERIADAQGVLDAPSGEYDVEVRVSADKDRRRWKKNREWAVVVRELVALAREAQEDLSATRDAMEAGRHLREAAEGERDRLKDALRAIRETTFENDWFEAQAIARAALADVGGTEEASE